MNSHANYLLLFLILVFQAILLADLRRTLAMKFLIGNLLAIKRTYKDHSYGHHDRLTI